MNRCPFQLNYSIITWLAVTTLKYQEHISRPFTFFLWLQFTKNHIPGAPKYTRFLCKCLSQSCCVKFVHSLVVHTMMVSYFLRNENCRDFCTCGIWPKTHRLERKQIQRHIPPLHYFPPFAATILSRKKEKRKWNAYFCPLSFFPKCDKGRRIGFPSNENFLDAFDKANSIMS